MRIRDAALADLPALLKINQSFLPRVSSVDLEWMQNYLSKAQYFRLIEDHGEPLGFLIAMLPDVDYGSVNYTWFKERYRSFLYIDRIAISESSQGQGCGTRLYRDVIEFAKGRAELVTCEVNVRPMNQQSLDFHKKFGFQEVGRQETYGGDITVSLMSVPV